MENHIEYKVGIDKEKSPEFMSLFKESDELVELIERFYNKMKATKLSRLWPFKNRRIIDSLLREHKETIEKAAITWKNNSNTFLYAPKYTVFAQDDRSHIVASIQAVNAVTIRVNEVNQEAWYLKNDFYQLMYRADTIMAFWYTYLALLLSALFGISGILIGLIQLFS
jgi:hypothetical protein